MSEDPTTRLDEASEELTRRRGVTGRLPGPAEADDVPLLPLPGRVLPPVDPPPRDDPAAEPDPARIDRFVVLGRLGRGGMGVVFSAYDPQLDRKVALKIVRADRFGSHSSGSGGARLLREAQAMAQLSHPNVVAVHQVGETDGGVYLAMEYVQGLTLRAWLKEQHERDPRRRGWRELLAVFLQAGEGLSAAHRAGLVHRDFKPDNVIVGKDGRVRVLDFGLARHDPRGGEPRPSGDVDLERTAAGAVVGTPAYMAPEQHEQQPCDARGDQYGFCTALWEALAGARPFRGASMKDLGAQKSRGVLPPVPKNILVPRWLWPALARGLRPRPDDRWPDMAALLAALRADPARVRMRAVAAACALGLAVAAPFAYQRAVERAEARALAARERVCDEVAAPAAAVWSDDRRGRLARHFDAAGLAGSWSAVEARIDGFVERWTAARAEVCRATRVRGEQSESLMKRRDACLDRALAGIDVRLDAMLTADGKALRRAGELLDGSPVELCTSSEQNSHVDPPDDPERISALVARVDRLRAEVELKGAKAIPDLDATLAALTADAEAARYRPLRAALGVLRGRVAELTGAYDEAERHYAGALYQAEVSRDDLAALDAYTHLVQTMTFHLRKLRETRVLLDRMRATVERVGDDPNLKAKLLRAEALLAAESGEFDQSAALFLRASQEHRKAGQDVRASTAYGNVGVLYNRKGQPREGVPYLEAAIAELDGRADASPSARSAPHINLGRALALLGESDRALAHLRTAAAIHREVGEDEPGELLAVLMQGEVLLERGDPAAALPLLLRALEFRRKAYGPGASYVATAALNVARAHVLLGELAAAEPLLAEAALHVRGDGYEEDSLAAYGHYVRGLLARARGDVRGAREQLERAHPIVVADGFTDRRLAVGVVLALADALWSDPPARPRARALVEELLPRTRACAADGACDPQLPVHLTAWLSGHA